MATTVCLACKRETAEDQIKNCVLCGSPGCPGCMDQVTDPDHIGQPHDAHRLCITIAKVLQRSLPIILRRML